MPGQMTLLFETRWDSDACSISPRLDSPRVFHRTSHPTAMDRRDPQRSRDLQRAEVRDSPLRTCLRRGCGPLARVHGSRPNRTRRGTHPLRRSRCAGSACRAQGARQVAAFDARCDEAEAPCDPCVKTRPGAVQEKGEVGPSKAVESGPPSLVRLTSLKRDRTSQPRSLGCCRRPFPRG